MRADHFLGLVDDKILVVGEVQLPVGIAVLNLRSTNEHDTPTEATATTGGALSAKVGDRDLDPVAEFEIFGLLDALVLRGALNRTYDQATPLWVSN